MADHKRKITIFLTTIVLTIGSILISAATADGPSVKKARELIQHIAGANLQKDQVQIKDISAGVGGGGVIVEARIETSFRMVKEKGDWRIADVRLGDRQWESFELIEEAIRREKERRTTALLVQLSEGVRAYQRERGQYVDTDKIAELLDYISPRYLPQPIRFDLWGKEIEYRGDARGYRISSAGADQKNGTNDDLIIDN